MRVLPEGFVGMPPLVMRGDLQGFRMRRQGTGASRHVGFCTAANYAATASAGTIQSTITWSCVHVPSDHRVMAS